MPINTSDKLIQEIIFEILISKKKFDRNLINDDDVLIFDNLYVNKKFRGENIGQLLIEATCKDFRRRGRFAFLKAYPLQFSGAEGFDELPDDRKKQILREKEEFKNRRKYFFQTEISIMWTSRTKKNLISNLVLT